MRHGSWAARIARKACSAPGTVLPGHHGSRSPPKTGTLRSASSPPGSASPWYPRSAPHHSEIASDWSASTTTGPRERCCSRGPHPPQPPSRHTSWQQSCATRRWHGTTTFAPRDRLAQRHGEWPRFGGTTGPIEEADPGAGNGCSCEDRRPHPVDRERALLPAVHLKGVVGDSVRR